MEPTILKGSIYISPKDIRALNDCGLRSAQKEHLMVRDALELNTKKLTVRAYCEYWTLDYEDIVRHLNRFRQ